MPRRIKGILVYFQMINLEYFNKTIYLYKNIMDIKNKLDSYLGKQGRYTEKEGLNRFKEVCDLETGDCYTIRTKDGLIERVDHIMNSNKKVRVETPSGLKQLLKD